MVMERNQSGGMVKWKIVEMGQEHFEQSYISMWGQKQYSEHRKILAIPMPGGTRRHTSGIDITGSLEGLKKNLQEFSIPMTSVFGQNPTIKYTTFESCRGLEQQNFEVCFIRSELLKCM